MVINSTNIHKRNYYLTSKLIEPKRNRTYNVGNKGLGMGQAQTFVGVIFAVVTRTINSWKLFFLSNWNFKAHHFRHNFVMKLLSMVGIFLTWLGTKRVHNCTTDVTNGTGTANPFEAREFNLCFSGRGCTPPPKIWKK